ncbi:MAG: hypothetical protein J6J30_05415 [Clostridia bacterium]|nr:hypothetical protein [Clostridia bacterium]
MKCSKPLVLALCAVLLVTAVIFGTVAYLKDSAEVVNTFTMGNVHLKLDEAVVDENGGPTGNRTETGNQYHLIPGKTYTKDPTVTVLKGSEKAYVRMLVTVNCYDELTTIFGDPFLPQYFVEGWDNTAWRTTGVISKDENANTATYEFRYFETVKPEKNVDLVLDPLFDTLTVPSSMTGEQLKTIDDLEITIEAHAIQATGFANADEAWNAFSK